MVPAAMKATFALLAGLAVIANPANGQKVPDFKLLPIEQIRADIAARQAKEAASNPQPAVAPSSTSKTADDSEQKQAAGEVRPHPTKPGIVLVPQWMIDQERNNEEERKRILAEQAAAEAAKLDAEFEAAYKSAMEERRREAQMIANNRRIIAAMHPAPPPPNPMANPGSGYPPEWNALIDKYNNSGTWYTLEAWEKEMSDMLLRRYPKRSDLFKELAAQAEAERKAEAINEAYEWEMARKRAAEAAAAARSRARAEAAMEEMERRELERSIQRAVDAAMWQHQNCR
jgi:hypothetical protein